MGICKEKEKEGKSRTKKSIFHMDGLVFTLVFSWCYHFLYALELLDLFIALHFLFVAGLFFIYFFDFFFPDT